MPAKLENLAVATGLEKVSFHSLEELMMSTQDKNLCSEG